MNIRDVNAGAANPLLNQANELTATQNGPGAQQAAGNKTNRLDRLILTPEGEQMRTTMQNLRTQRRPGNLQTGVLAQEPRLGAMTNPLTQPQAQAGQAVVGGNERPGILEQNPRGGNAVLAGNPVPEQTPQGLNQFTEGVPNPNEQQQNPGVAGGVQPRGNTAAQERENPLTPNPERTNQDNLNRFLQMEAERTRMQNQPNQNPVLDLLV